MVFSLALLQAEAQNPVTYYYGDSTISAVGYFKNNQPHGLWKNFYHNGQLKSIGKRFYGKLDSTWTFYFNDGQIKTQIQYDKGIKNGFAYIYKKHSKTGSYLYKKRLYIDGKLHDKAFIYYPNGNIKSVTQYTEGTKTGTQINFYPDQTPKSIIDYRNNKAVSFQKINQFKDRLKSGTWIKIDDQFNIKEEIQYTEGKQTQVKSIDDQFREINYTIEGLENKQKDSLFEGKFVDGQPVGRHIWYDSAGAPFKYILYDSLSRKIESGRIKNYQKSGPVNGFYLNGNIKYEGNYHKEKRHGKWTFFYKDGESIEQEGFYHTGKLNGKWVWFFKNQDTLRIENYRYADKEGLYISYEGFGNIIQKGEYYDDLKQGLWLEKRGQVTFKGKYFDGERDGHWIGHYNNGFVAFEGNYVRGKRNGKFIYYYPSGIKRRIEFYKFGKSVGHWQFFDQSGNLYKVKTYKEGESIYYKP